MDDFEDDEENMWEGRHEVGDVSVDLMLIQWVLIN